MKKLILSLAILACSTTLAMAECERISDHAWKCEPPQRPATPVKPMCRYFDDDYICNTDRIGEPVTVREKLVEPENCGWRNRNGKQKHVCW